MGTLFCVVLFRFVSYVLLLVCHWLVFVFICAMNLAIADLVLLDCGIVLMVVLDYFWVVLIPVRVVCLLIDFVAHLFVGSCCLVWFDCSRLPGFPSALCLVLLFVVC